MSLVLSRLPGEKIYIFLASQADSEEVLRKLYTTGIEVRIDSFKGRQVRVGIDAPLGLTVLREELCGGE